MASPGPDAASFPLVVEAHDELIGETLISADKLQARIAELGAEITKDYAGKTPLLVAVLKGAFIFMADLCREIDTPLGVDFMAISSYGASTRSSGVVRIVKDLDIDLADRHVIIVEDIVDSGLTLRYLRRTLEPRSPASLEVCALFVRADNVLDDLDLRYIGFEIPPDPFIIGYGLDVAQRYRNLRDIRVYDGD